MSLNRRLPAQLLPILAEEHFPPSRLEIEITFANALRK
jgi:hypothetical protein